ncbi:uncharacterized protein LOC131160818 [Malania oleifera]|uniref:uncharacterized protein LOC131160818 n=1 Tax=Malania oleifera TaxID=397392 RepID=UPI0025ADDA46|nr:uncharacterized protein LOC131160818 [Malania oleifera]
MCNGEFFSKEPNEILSFFNYLAESAQQWNTSHERAPMVAQPLSVISGGGRYEVKEETSLQARVAALFKKLEVMALEKVKVEDCFIYDTSDHRIQDCHLLLVWQESRSDRAPVILGRPFLASSNVLINCLRVLKLTFENMTLEMNMFNNMTIGCDDLEVDAVDVEDDLDMLELLSAFGCDGAFENKAPEQPKVFDEKVPLIRELLESEGKSIEIDAIPACDA